MLRLDVLFLKYSIINILISWALIKTKDGRDFIWKT